MPAGTPAWPSPGPWRHDRLCRCGAACRIYIDIDIVQRAAATTIINLLVLTAGDDLMPQHSAKIMLGSELLSPYTSLAVLPHPHRISTIPALGLSLLYTIYILMLINTYI